MVSTIFYTFIKQNYKICMTDSFNVRDSNVTILLTYDDLSGVAVSIMGTWWGGAGNSTIVK